MPQSGFGGAATARETQVAGQFNRLHGAAKALLENITNLDNRLSPILRGSMPSPQENSARPKDALVPHAEQMSSFADLIEIANVKLEEIINRIEL